MHALSRTSLSLLFLTFVACGAETDAPKSADATTEPSDAGVADIAHDDVTGGNEDAGAADTLVADITTVDATSAKDTIQPIDSAVSPDSSSSVVDTSVNDTGSTDAGTTDIGVLDAGTKDSGSADAGSTDAGQASDTAGSWSWPTNRPKGQCTKSSECKTNGGCNAKAPGGICLGCGTCPSGYDCMFGACALWCDKDSECPVGLTCLTSKGVCRVPKCKLDSDCEGPFVCDNGLCARPKCGAGCPSGMACTGGWCSKS
ncbi:MAG: hypothetical protein KC502_19405 [Myxococcales bacterium]|nr:hypothetical protein [Myxococcales bacterium]